MTFHLMFFALVFFEVFLKDELKMNKRNVIYLNLKLKLKYMEDNHLFISKQLEIQAFTGFETMIELLRLYRVKGH